MEFYEVVAQVVQLLQQQGRVTYRGLKRQFALDDDFLADLKEEIIDAQRVAVEEDGRILVWTGDIGSPAPDAQHGVDEETQFYTVLQAVRSLLGQERRVTYRRLKYVFSLDDALIEEIREELGV
jgi:hypothetical protein